MTKTVGVIGAGMVGVIAATFLQRAGFDVFLLERDAPGEGASFGNAGCLNGSSVVPMSLPGTIKSVPHWVSDPLGPLSIRPRYLATLAPWLIRFAFAGTPSQVAQQAKALRALIAPSIDILMPLVRDAGVPELIEHRGSLFLFRSEHAWRKEASAWMLRSDNGVRWEELQGDQLRELEPSLSREYVKGVLVRENGHTTNPHRLVNSLVAAFRRKGGKLERARALGFEIERSRLKAIRTDRGLLEADAAVVSAGIWSKALAAELGDRIPLETERGYHVTIRDPEAQPRMPIADAEHKFAATPMETGLRIAGTVELASLAAPPNWQRARALLVHAGRMFPALAREYAEDRVTLWMGHRPSLPDSLPVIGPARRTSDVIYAFGHGHIGMVAAPMTGKVVAELVSRSPTGIDVSAFRADRFGTVWSGS
jgi:D-amino-acid dehydrogenase